MGSDSAMTIGRHPTNLLKPGMHVMWPTIEPGGHMVGTVKYPLKTHVVVMALMLYGPSERYELPIEVLRFIPNDQYAELVTRLPMRRRALLQSTRENPYPDCYYEMLHE